MNTAKLDWFRILRDLAGAGITMADVGRKCNRNRFTVNNWSEGQEPRESDGRIVLSMYAKHCPDKFKQYQAEFGIYVGEDPEKETMRRLLLLMTALLAEVHA